MIRSMLLPHPHAAHLLLPLLCLFLSVSLPALAQTSPDASIETPLSFIAIGDMPYSPDEKSALENEIPRAIRTHAPPFVVHYGDIKSGKSNCDNATLRENMRTLHQLYPGRVIYTPGDNEWTDCDRAVLSKPRSELERLEFIRHLMNRNKNRFPAPWQFSRQIHFPENARWLKDGVLFTTVHWVGTNNGRKEILKDDMNLTLAMVDAREQANRVWLEQAAQSARDARARALVVITQADVTLGAGAGACNAENRIDCDAFAGFREQLKTLAAIFQGKPVLLVHGDTNPFCWDKRFGGEQAPNLWRLNAWGDGKTPPDATLITLQTATPQTPFVARTLIHNQEPDERCN